jgi:putative transcriptional regulator
MSDAYTMKKAARPKVAAAAAKFDWSALDAMTEEERRAAAKADPDARPITAADVAAGLVPLVPRTRTLRRALRLSQEEFADHYCIPVGTLRDWEQGRKEPDAAAKAYLDVIASMPDLVRKALAQRPKPLLPLTRTRLKRRSMPNDLYQARGLEEAPAPSLKGGRGKPAVTGARSRKAR